MAAATAKQYLQIHNKPILEHTINAFLAHSQISNIIVVLHPDDIIFHTLNISSHANVHTVVGGSERVDSVLAGLHHLAKAFPANQFTLVHDAARPCIGQADITHLIHQCTANPLGDNVCGAILACPVTDTIKQANIEDSSAITINTTVDRSLLWQAQTPQMFMLDELTRAIEIGLANGEVLTDEASAIERAGRRVMLVEGSSSNIKITKREDLALAAFYISARTASGQAQNTITTKE